MRNAVTIPLNTLILVWWDGQAIATVNGNTEGVIQAIEKACSEHSCFDVILHRPVDINLGEYDANTLKVTIKDGDEEWESSIELTVVTNYEIFIS